MPSEQETSRDGDRQRGSCLSPSAVAPPPDGGYGWVCVLACFLVNGFTWGITASYGVYLSYYLSNALFPSSTPLSYAFIGGLNFSAAMLPSPLITLLTRLYGKHATMSLGILFQALGYSLASVSTRLWHLYLSQGVLVGLGTGFLYIPSTAILSQWFERKRSLANGIAAAGSGVGGAAFAWGTGAMIASLGVGWALRVTAIIGFVANSVATLSMRDRNKAIQPPQLAFDGKLLRRLDVWLLLGWAFVSMLGYIVLLFSLADFARTIGVSTGQATTIVGLLNIGTAVGRPVIGIWSDRFRRVDVAAILTAVNGVACFAFWLPARGFGLTAFFALFVGGILGVFWMTIGPLCAELVGLKDMPSLLSISWLTVVLPSTFSEVIGLELRRDNAEFPYLYTQIYAGVTYLVAAVLMTALAVLKRRQASKTASCSS